MNVPTPREIFEKDRDNKIIAGLVDAAIHNYEIGDGLNITVSQSEAAAVIIANGNVSAAERIWVGSHGPWAETAGTDIRTSPKEVIYEDFEHADKLVIEALKRLPKQ